MAAWTAGKYHRFVDLGRRAAFICERKSVTRVPWKLLCMRLVVGKFQLELLSIVNLIMFCSAHDN